MIHSGSKLLFALPPSPYPRPLLLASPSRERRLPRGAAVARAGTADGVAAGRGGISGTASAMGTGTVTGWPQAWHFLARPAQTSGAESAWPHFGHGKRNAIVHLGRSP